MGILKASLLALLAGLVSLALLSQPGALLAHLAVPLLLVGIGMGLSAGLVDGLALKTVPEQQAGMAAGLLNTFRLGSEAVAVALYGSLLATFLGQQLGPRIAPLVEGPGSLKGWLDATAAGNLDGLPAPPRVCCRVCNPCCWRATTRLSMTCYGCWLASCWP